MYCILSHIESWHQNQDLVSVLPEEVSIGIFMILEDAELLTCRLVCKTWLQICETLLIQERIENYKRQKYEQYWNLRENNIAGAVTPVAKAMERLAFGVDVVQKLFNTSPVPDRLFASPSPVSIGRMTDRSPDPRKFPQYLSPPSPVSIGRITDRSPDPREFHQYLSPLSQHSSSSSMKSSPVISKRGSTPIFHRIKYSPLIPSRMKSPVPLRHYPNSSPIPKQHISIKSTSPTPVVRLFDATPENDCTGLDYGSETLYPSQSSGKMTQRLYVNAKKVKKKTTPRKDLLRRL